MLPAEWVQLNLAFAAHEGQAGQAGPLFTGLAELLERSYVRDRRRPCWWFVRKQPGLRLRLLRSSVDRLALEELDALIEGERGAGRVRECWRSCYEPERDRLGGPELLPAVHELFGVNAQTWQAWSARSTQGMPREWLALLLYADLVEQATEAREEAWDVWAVLHRVYLGRPAPSPSPTPAGKLSVQLLRTLAKPGERELIDRALAANARFAKHLARVERDEELVGGRRALLGALSNFHWNTWGLPPASIATLVAAMVDELHPARAFALT